tara:strand:+ start:240 stop:593 length:354 start_codon:yes stop_codon:yes gene_type:complete
MFNFKNQQSLFVGFLISVIFFLIGTTSGNTIGQKEVISKLLDQQLASGDIEYITAAPESEETCISIVDRTDGVQFLVANSKLIEKDFCASKDSSSEEFSLEESKKKGILAFPLEGDE